MTPTRDALIVSYWFKGLSIKKVATAHGVSRCRAVELFEQYNIPIRSLGGRGNRGSPTAKNRIVLELMLLPPVEEWDGVLWRQREARG